MYYLFCILNLAVKLENILMESMDLFDQIMSEICLVYCLSLLYVRIVLLDLYLEGWH